MRLVRLGWDRHVGHVLGSYRDHLVQSHALSPLSRRHNLHIITIVLLLSISLMIGLSLLLASLELFETLHDGAIGEAFLMLHCRHTGLELVVDVVPGARSVLVLRWSHGQLEATAIVRVVIGSWARFVMVLQRLDNGRTRWDQIQISTLQLFLESLNFPFALFSSGLMILLLILVLVLLVLVGIWRQVPFLGNVIFVAVCCLGSALRIFSQL